MPNIKPDKQAVVYALSDPRNKSIPKYIGKTASSLRRRLACHLCWAKSHPAQPLALWITSLASIGILPVIYAIENGIGSHIKDRETHWIRFFRPLGSLLNHSDGDGTLGLKMGPPCLENRLITIARNKRGLSPLSREKLSLALTGRKMASEQKSARLLNPRVLATTELLKTFNASRCKPVVTDDGRRYASINDAARKNGISGPSVRRSIKSGTACHIGICFSFGNQSTHKP